MLLSSVLRPSGTQALDNTEVGGSFLIPSRDYPIVSVIVNVTALPSGGLPSLTVYLQHSYDGTTWRDIARQQFTTALNFAHFRISAYAAGSTTSEQASDAALGSNSVIQGPWGNYLRVKAVTVAALASGTYTWSGTAYYGSCP